MDHDFQKFPPWIRRYSERVFRRYEPIFHRVVSVHRERLRDEVIEVKFSGSLQVHINDMRNAFNSLIANKWETQLDVNKLELIWPSLAFKPIPKTHSVQIFPKLRGAIAATNKSLTTAQSQLDLAVDNPSEIVLRAILVLQHHQALPKRAFEITNLSPELQKRLATFQQEFPNVVFDYPAPNNPAHLLII